MTKDQFLKRMANAWDMGLCDPKVLGLAELWCDAIMRLEGGQMNYWNQFFNAECERLDFFASNKVLANDRDGYKIIQLMAILTHHCQKCAVDPEAWHTRSGFCNHKDEKNKH